MSEGELELFFEKFVEHISGDYASINFVQFKNFMPQIIKWWESQSQSEQTIFNYLDPESSVKLFYSFNFLKIISIKGYIYMEEVLTLVEILLKKSLKERLICILSTFSFLILHLNNKNDASVFRNF